MMDNGYKFLIQILTIIALFSGLFWQSSEISTKTEARFKDIEKQIEILQIKMQDCAAKLDTHLDREK